MKVGSGGGRGSAFFVSPLGASGSGGSVSRKGGTCVCQFSPRRIVSSVERSRKVSPGKVTEVTVAVPKSLWRYSTLADHWSFKAYSTPAPSVQPKRSMLNWPLPPLFAVELKVGSAMLMKSLAGL